MKEQAKADFLNSKARLERAFANTPDDRINWSPSPSARTAVEQVVHSAHAIGNIHSWLSGTDFTPPTSAEADLLFREQEKSIRTREEALALLEQNSTKFIDWMDSLSPEDLDQPATAPFGLGEFPVGFGLRFPGLHTNDHAAQMEYMQTIYGDRDWHTGF